MESESSDTEIGNESDDGTTGNYFPDDAIVGLNSSAVMLFVKSEGGKSNNNLSTNPIKISGGARPKTKPSTVEIVDSSDCIFGFVNGMTLQQFNSHVSETVYRYYDIILRESQCYFLDEM